MLVTVTICGGLLVPTLNEPKDRLVGNTVTWLPLPLRLTVCGLPAALSVIASVPLRKPPLVGLKVTDIEQFLPAAKFALQLLVCAKSPVVAMLAILSAAFPVLDKVTGFAELVVPIDCDPKSRLFTESEATDVGVAVGVRDCVAVGVAVRVAVAVLVAVAVDVAVRVGVDVAVAVSVAVAVAVGVGVAVALSVAVAVAVTVGVAVSVAVAVAVAVSVAVGVSVAVDDSVAVAVTVGVAVAVGVGVAAVAGWMAIIKPPV